MLSDIELRLAKAELKLAFMESEMIQTVIDNGLMNTSEIKTALDSILTVMDGFKAQPAYRSGTSSSDSKDATDLFERNRG